MNRVAFADHIFTDYNLIQSINFPYLKYRTESPSVNLRVKYVLSHISTVHLYSTITSLGACYVTSKNSPITFLCIYIYSPVEHCAC